MYSKVIYIVKTDLHYYPPCMMQIRYLNACGVRTEVWFASSNDSALQILDRENIPYVCLGESPRKKSKLSKVKNWLEFRKNVQQKLKLMDPTKRDKALLWIGTAESAIPLLGLLNKYHYNLTMLELLDDRKNAFKRRMFGLMAKKAEAVVACEETRAYLMRYWFGLKKLPYIMPNKPYELNVEKFTEPTCAQTRNAVEQVNGKKFIIFQGIYQKLEYMKALVEALATMNSEYYFVLMGFDLNKTNAYEELRKIYDKVIEVPSLPAPLHLEVTSHAHIGLVFYDDSTLNQAYCAPNKIFEYSGFAIPMLANKIPGLEHTVGKYGAGRCVEFRTEELARGIRELDANYAAYSRNATRLYESVDNRRVIETIIEDIEISKGQNK